MRRTQKIANLAILEDAFHFGTVETRVVIIASPPASQSSLSCSAGLPVRVVVAVIAVPAIRSVDARIVAVPVVVVVAELSIVSSLVPDETIEVSLLLVEFVSSPVTPVVRLRGAHRHRT